ncbi:MAG: hypothetical protein ACJ8F4_02490 [Sphingomonas sp.]
MKRWLAIGTAVSFVWANGASAQLNGLTPGDIAGGARTRALGLRLSQPAPPKAPHKLADGMLVSRDVAPNATLGLGLAVSHQQAGTEFRMSATRGRRRKPALTFLLHF